MMIPPADTVDTLATAPLPPPPVNRRASLTTKLDPPDVIVKLDDIVTFPIVVLPIKPVPPPPDTVRVGGNI